MKYANHKEVPDNKIVWACAYSMNDNEKTNALKKEPVRGMITDEGKYGQKVFKELKAGGINKEHLKKSGQVYAYNRCYADTYEESVDMYNELIDKQIKRLQRIIEECEKDKI